MGELIINEGCWDSLAIGEKRNDNLVQVFLDDKDMLINREEAQQIINHLKTQFEL